jgi:hypothetical protein
VLEVYCQQIRAQSMEEDHLDSDNGCAPIASYCEADYCTEDRKYVCNSAYMSYGMRNPPLPKESS